MGSIEKFKKGESFIKGVFAAGLISITMISCNSDDDVNIQYADENLNKVSFELDADMLSMGVISRAVTPIYNAGGFSIYAFKQESNGVGYSFSQMLHLTNARYISETKTFTGDAYLEAGNYKFIPAYGLNSNQNVSLALTRSDLLSDEITLRHAASGSNGNNLPEIFLPDEYEYNYRVANVQSYDMDALGRLTESVKLRITRAVGRVDVMFIKATKNGNTYTEVQTTEGQNVFGNKGLNKMELRFSGLSQQMNLLGMEKSGKFNAAIDIQNLGSSGNAMTIGTRQGASLIGTDDYIRFDAIQPEDIIYGAAHVTGTYLIPNEDNNPTTGVQVYIESAGGTNRTINITNDNDNIIPLARNKVTLIKIYILDGGGGTVDPPVDPPGPVDPPIDPPGPVDPPVDPPGPPSVYEADIKVEVEFVDWYESNHVEEEIDLSSLD